MAVGLSSDHCCSSKTHSEPEPELRTEDGLRAGPWGQGMTRDNLLRTTTTTNKNIFGQLLLLQCLHWVDHGNYLLMGSKNYQFLVNKLFSPPHEQKLRWWKYGKSVLVRFDCANTKYYVVIHLLSDTECGNGDNQDNHLASIPCLPPCLRSSFCFRVPSSIITFKETISSQEPLTLNLTSVR